MSKNPRSNKGKTIAVRLKNHIHTRLLAIADKNYESITDIITRLAIEEIGRNDQAADDKKRLAEYVTHEEDCKCMTEDLDETECTCGLYELIEDIIPDPSDDRYCNCDVPIRHKSPELILIKCLKCNKEIDEH